MKNIEDNCIRYDYSVRTSNGNIVQFKYGDDGLEPTQQTTAAASSPMALASCSTVIVSRSRSTISIFLGEEPDEGRSSASALARSRTPALTL